MDCLCYDLREIDVFCIEMIGEYGCFCYGFLVFVLVLVFVLLLCVFCVFCFGLVRYSHGCLTDERSVGVWFWSGWMPTQGSMRDLTQLSESQRFHADYCRSLLSQVNHERLAHHKLSAILQFLFHAYPRILDLLSSPHAVSRPPSPAPTAQGYPAPTGGYPVSALARSTVFEEDDDDLANEPYRGTYTRGHQPLPQGKAVVDDDDDDYDDARFAREIPEYEEDEDNVGGYNSGRGATPTHKFYGSASEVVVDSARGSHQQQQNMGLKVAAAAKSATTLGTKTAASASAASLSASQSGMASDSVGSVSGTKSALRPQSASAVLTRDSLLDGQSEKSSSRPPSGSVRFFPTDKSSTLMPSPTDKVRPASAEAFSPSHPPVTAFSLVPVPALAMSAVAPPDAFVPTVANLTAYLSANSSFTVPQTLFPPAVAALVTPTETSLRILFKHYGTEAGADTLPPKHPAYHPAPPVASHPNQRATLPPRRMLQVVTDEMFRLLVQHFYIVPELVSHKQLQLVLHGPSVTILPERTGKKDKSAPPVVPTITPSAFGPTAPVTFVWVEFLAALSRLADVAYAEEADPVTRMSRLMELLILIPGSGIQLAGRLEALNRTVTPAALELPGQGSARPQPLMLPGYTGAGRAGSATNSARGHGAAGMLMGSKTAPSPRAHIIDRAGVPFAASPMARHSSGTSGPGSPPSSAFGQTLHGGTGLSPSRMSPRRRDALKKRTDRAAYQHQSVSAPLGPRDLSIMEPYDQQLRQVFDHYSRTVSAVRGITSSTHTFAGLTKSTHSLDLASISVFCRDANMVPLLVSRAQLTEAFRLANRGLNSDEDPLAVSFPEFKEVLARLAMAAYPKSRYTPAELAHLKEDDLAADMNDGRSASEKISRLLQWLHLENWRAPGTAALERTMSPSVSTEDLQARVAQRESLLGSEVIAQLIVTPECAAILNASGTTTAFLKKIFQIYSAKGQQFEKPLSFDASAMESTTVNLGELLAILKDFQVYPQLVSRDAVIAIFKSRCREGTGSLASSAEDKVSLMTFNEFKDVVARLGLFIFAHSTYSHEHEDGLDGSDLAKVTQMLAYLQTVAMDPQHYGALKPFAAVLQASGNPVSAAGLVGGIRGTVLPKEYRTTPVLSRAPSPAKNGRPTAGKK
jgi:hypothetical protein